MSTENNEKRAFRSKRFNKRGNKKNYQKELEPTTPIVTDISGTERWQLRMQLNLDYVVGRQKAALTFKHLKGKLNKEEFGREIAWLKQAKSNVSEYIDYVEDQECDKLNRNVVPNDVFEELVKLMSKFKKEKINKKTGQAIPSNDFKLRKKLQFCLFQAGLHLENLDQFQFTEMNEYFKSELAKISKFSLEERRQLLKELQNQI